MEMPPGDELWKLVEIILLTWIAARIYFYIESRLREIRGMLDGTFKKD